MEKRFLGRTGMEVSVLGFGGAEVGFQGADPGTVRQLLDSALDAGLNVIDTAECYGNGTVSSEELIGDAAAHRRGEFFLFTKCGHASGFEGKEDWNPQMLADSIDRSLKRLKTDCVDLLQLHSCSEELLRRGEVIEVVQRARDAGKARFTGYSGDNEAARYAVECGLFDALQTSVSIADQKALAETLPLAQERGMGVIAKRPLANVVWRHTEETVRGYDRPYWDRLRALDFPFLRDGASDAVSWALRFTLSAPGVSTAIAGTANPRRWRENAALLDAGLLTEAEYAEIRLAWQAHPDHADWQGQV